MPRHRLGAVHTLSSAISTPGKETAGGSFVRACAATVAKVGNTRRSRS